MGKNRDVYIAQGEAADNYCGRVLVGLPVNHKKIAVSYVHFIPVTAAESLNGGMGPDEYQRQQHDLNTEVDACLEQIFGAERSPHHRLLLRIGLASHLWHRNSYDGIVPSRATSTLVKLLPDKSPLRRTPLFTCSRILALSEYVSIAMPWENHYRYFKQPTGIPPHSLLLGYVRGLKQSFGGLAKSFDALPGKIGEMLNEQATRVGLTLNQIV